MNDSWQKISQLSRKELSALQNKKLQEFIAKQIYPFSPHYRKIFDQNKIDPRSVTSIADLKKIPFTSKADFIDTQTEHERYRSFILQPTKEKIKENWSKTEMFKMAMKTAALGGKQVQHQLEKEYRPSFITYTTGTTYMPIPFLYTDYDIKNLHTAGRRLVGVFGLQKEDKLINMFPYAPHLAFWQVSFGGIASGVLVLNTGGGKVMGTEGNILALVKMRPSTIIGVPSYVYHVLRTANEKGYRLEFIQKIVLGAARIPESFKARIRELLKCMGAENVCVFGTYGFTEGRMAWPECPTAPGVSSGYHVYPDKEIFEVIDPQTGEVKGEGEDGELVYTSIDSRGSSLIRYRTGDFVKGGIIHEPCPHCGRTVPRISSDITRMSDIKNLNLSKIKGQLVNLNNFVLALAKYDQIKEWQIEIRKKNNDPYELDELTVYICVEDYLDKNRIEKDIRDSILLATEVSPNSIQFISFQEIISRLELETASKEKRILDLREQT